jgi:Glycosyl transferase family 11
MLKRTHTKTFVATQVLGGLGNQLFAYAAGRGLAHRLGASLILDCTRRLQGDRAFCLNRYSIDAHFIFDGPPKVHGRYFKLPGQFGMQIADRIHAVVPRTTQIDGHRFRVIEERELYNYDKRFDGLTGSIYLKGGWQSLRYFEDAADIIRAELTSNLAPSEVNRSWLDRALQNQSVCVHVRRGDYIKRGFGLCSSSYYAEAAKLIRERVENPTFFIFSDDLPWCRENLPIEEMVLVDANGPDDPVSELMIMSSCRHHIIANSSFSWWAAWLGSRRDQVVIAPEPWVSICPSVPQLLPSNWVRVACS